MNKTLTTETDNFRGASENNSLKIDGYLDPARSYTDLQMADGRVFRLPTEVLLSGFSTGPYAQGEMSVANVSEDNDATEIIPVVEEQLTVGKRTVATGRIRLQKSVQEYQETLDERLAVQTFDVERIVLNRVVEVVPEERQEGDTTIYPLIEERLVLTKEFILKEEIRVTRRNSEKRDTQVVTLQREHMSVERLPV